MLIDPSNFLRVQAAMHKVSGQTIPQTPPSGLACMISAAERRRSDGFPRRAAMMKSKGEQLTGTGLLAGLFLAILAAQQLRLELRGGHGERIFFKIFHNRSPFKFLFE